MSFQDQIYNVALSDGMPSKLAAMISAQAAHETGNFTSPVFMDCNNAFGYNAVRSFCNGHTIYQNYPTVADSVHELTAWIRRRLNEGNFPTLINITDPFQYAQLLKDNGYYTDSVNVYAAGISNYLNDFKGHGSFAIIAGLFLFILTIKKRPRRIGQ